MDRASLTTPDATTEASGAPARREDWWATARATAKRLLPWVLGALGLAMGIGLWLALKHWHLVSDIKLPTPQQLADRFQEQSGDLVHNLWLTLERSLIGFGAGSAAGILVALIASWNRVAEGLAEPIIQLLKPVPALVLTPFMIVWFGADAGGVISLAIWGCFFVMVIEAQEAFRNAPRVYRWAARTLGDSSWGVHLRVLLPYSVPHLIGGLRISMVAAVNLVILGEFNASSGGLGDLIVRGYSFLQPDLMFFGVLLAVLLAFALDCMVRLIRLSAGRWA